MTMIGNEALQFRKSPGEDSRPQYAQPHHLRCRHEGGLEVDEDARQVTCAKCGRELDACAVAILWMNKENLLDWRVERIEKFEAKERARNAKAEERRRKKADDAIATLEAVG